VGKSLSQPSQREGVSLFRGDWGCNSKNMNKEIKKFYTNRKKEDFFFEDIHDADFSTIPNDKQGVYILVAKKGKFLYPSKKYSPVFYIGMSINEVV